MSKTVKFTKRPSASPVAASEADAWVSSRGSDVAVNAEKRDVPDVPMKRLTIDIPESLHARVKSQCAKRGTKMADEIRALLETHFPESG
jgi:ParG